MRSIKFRAWDGKKMHYPKTLDFGFNGYTGNPAISFQMDNGGYTITEHCMQFTGLLDKNGVEEVFVGDIVEGFHKKYVIEWSIYGWGLRRDDKCFTMDVGNTKQNEWDSENPKLENFKVIGNIWETPELLK